VRTFLGVDLDFLFVEPGLEGVEMFLEVEGCCGRVIIRGKDGFIVSEGSYDSGGVLRNVCCVHLV
jgi:hypothetical protein